MSRAQTVIVPNVNAIGGTTGPAILARATREPQRALISNSGPNVVLLSFEAGPVSDPSQIQGAFRVNPGTDVVFVLEVTDQIYASALGANGLVSIHVSPAFPLGGSWGVS